VKDLLDDGRALALVLVALGAGITLSRLERVAMAGSTATKPGSGGGQDAEAPEAVWKKGQRFYLDLPWRVGPVLFDPRQDAGSIGVIGYVSNIVYGGFAIWMTVDDFLRLNPSRQFDPQRQGDTVQWFEDRMRRGEPVGPPWINLMALEYEDYDGQDDVPVAFRVRGHEGRGRMTALKRLVGGDAVIPVYCNVQGGYRAHHLRHEKLIGATMAADPRSLSARRSEAPFVIQRITIDGIDR